MAKRSQSLVTPARKALQTRRVIAVLFLIGCLISFRLWIPVRSYPQIPLVNMPVSLGLLDFLFAPALFLALLGLVRAGIRDGLAEKSTFLVLGCLIFLCLTDSLRLQSWVYQYGIFLAFLSPMAFGSRTRSIAESDLNPVRLAMVGIYLWAGLHKLNITYFAEIHPWLLSPLVHLGPPEGSEWILAASGPLTEIFIAVALVFPLTRNLAVIVSSAMHGFVLILLVFGHGWNEVVWPWNLAMPWILWRLFWNWRERWALPAHLWRTVATGVVFLLLPALGFFNYWDAYLSFKLYAGNTARAFVTVDGPAVEILGLPQRIIAEKDPPIEFAPAFWSLCETRVPARPAASYYIGFYEEICKRARERGISDPDIRMKIQLPADRWTGERITETYEHCNTR